MKRPTFFASTLAIAGVLALTQSPSIQGMPQTLVTSQQGADTHHPAAAAPPKTGTPEVQAMPMHDQMMGDMKAMDDAIEPLVASMNAAKGEAKVEAMAAVITALVQQRGIMRGASVKMEGEMMAHMRKQMSADMSPEMKKAMSDCPMMKMMQPIGSNK